MLANKESRIEVTDRLRREGRWGEASVFRDDERRRLRTEGTPKTEAIDAAWQAMIDRFPPIPAEPVQLPLDETDLSVDYAVLAERLGDSRPDLTRDSLWVYEHLENKQIQVSDAPSLGAWSLLKWARESRNRFFEQLIPKAIAAKQKQADDQEFSRKEQVSIEEVEDMLEEFNATFYAGLTALTESP
jgi:hypothetical protein